MNHMVAIFMGCVFGYVMLGFVLLAAAMLVMEFRWCSESGLGVDRFSDVLKDFDEWLFDDDMPKKERARNAAVFCIAWPRELPNRLNRYDAMFKEWYADWRKEKNIT